MGKLFLLRTILIIATTGIFMTAFDIYHPLDSLSRWYHQKNPEKGLILYQTIDKSVLYQTVDKSVTVLVPDKRYARGSLAIRIPNPTSTLFKTKDSIEIDKICFEKQNAIAQKLHDDGYHYMFYSRLEDKFFKQTIHAVPYTPEHWLLQPITKMIQQIRVLVRLRFGGKEVTQAQVEELKKNYATPLQNSETILENKKERKISDEEKAKCPFCKDENKKKQLVAEGEHVMLFYNIRQIGQIKNDLLIIPKEHRVGFHELTAEEGIEMAQMARKVSLYYLNKDCKLHLFDKTGDTAGLTVDHFHRHILVEKISTPDSTTFWSIIKNMFWGRALPTEEVKAAADQLKKELKEVLDN